LGAKFFCNGQNFVMDCRLQNCQKQKNDRWDCPK
jgi:hypothetical protein